MTKQCPICQDNNEGKAVSCRSCGTVFEEKEEKVSNVTLMPSSIDDPGGAEPGFWVTSVENNEKPEEIHEHEVESPSMKVALTDDVKAEAEKLQKLLKEEIAGEGVEVELPSSNFSTPATDREVFLGRTNEDILLEYDGLADNIFFHLRDMAFTIGLKRRVLPRSKEREWMSDGLLEVIKLIEMHQKGFYQRVPHQDQEWLAIMKRVEELLAEGDLKGPLEMIREDTFVLEGKVNKLRFTMPSVSVRKVAANK